MNGFHDNHAKVILHSSTIPYRYKSSNCCKISDSSMTLVIETIPTDLRGVVYNAVQGIFVVGQMWAALTISYQ